MLYCDYTQIHNRWICQKCGATVPKNISPQIPFSVCKLSINDNKALQIVLEKRATPFGESNKSIIKEYPLEGPGTELKKILSYIGIKSSESCSCNTKAKVMNLWGSEKCKQNIEIIIDWLQEEARKRKLPFVRHLAKLLINRAIKNYDNKR
jgi:hypothetical protein